LFNKNPGGEEICGIERWFKSSGATRPCAFGTGL